MGLRSGDWLGHSRTLMCFFLRNSFVALAVCFVSLSCWNTHPRHIFNALAGFNALALMVHGSVHHPIDGVQLSCPLSRMGLRNGWNAFVCVSLRLESHSQKALEKQRILRNGHLFTVRFQLVFFFFSRDWKKTRDCTTFTLQDFYIESMTAHRIKINDHSCFHNSWPNSKTKLKLKHLWEQGGPLVFRGPYAACVFCV